MYKYLLNLEIAGYVESLIFIMQSLSAFQRLCNLMPACFLDKIQPNTTTLHRILQAMLASFAHYLFSLKWKNPASLAFLSLTHIKICSKKLYFQTCFPLGGHFSEKDIDRVCFCFWQCLLHDNMHLKQTICKNHIKRLQIFRCWWSFLPFFVHWAELSSNGKDSEWRQTVRKSNQSE